MASDDWARERAEDLADLAVEERHNAGMYSRVVEAFETALREAEQRGRQSILDRLKNDEALVKVVITAIDDYYDGTRDAPFENSVVAVLRALAAALEDERREKMEA